MNNEKYPVEPGDRFFDTLDCCPREVDHVGQFNINSKGYPEWDDSVFCTDGGVASAKEVWDNIIEF